MLNFNNGTSKSRATIPITAVLPIKDGVKYIARARCQLENTCGNKDEILVINDNSTDGSLEELNKWAKEDKRVRILNNEGDGLVAALNLGIMESTNNWIARFDIDDTYDFERIQNQISALKPTVVGVFSDYKILRPNGQSLGVIPSPVDSDAVEISLVSSRRTAHPSVLFSKEAVISVGGYVSQDFPAEDLSLWLRLSRVGQLVSVPEILLNYELGLNSVSGQKRDLIQKKTSYLIHEIGLKHSSLTSAHQRVDEILESYIPMNFGKERQILFLQELSKAFRISGRNKNFTTLEKLIKRLDTGLIGAGLSISAGAIKRRTYRKFG